VSCRDELVAVRAEEIGTVRTLIDAAAVGLEAAADLLGIGRLSSPCCAKQARGVT
jgi:hypothetical protein